MSEPMGSLRGKKILVTGGGGFIGTNVCKRLVAEGAAVKATSHKRGPRYPVDGVEYMHSDLTEKEDCLRVTKDIDAVVLTAAFVAGAQGMLKSPMQLVTDTVILNLRILEAAFDNGVKKCIYISSGMVYPFSKEPLKEESGYLGDPYDKYFTGGWSRRFIEVVCRMYAEKLQAMDITVLRIDNLYGPYDNFEHRKSHVMPSLIRKTVERMDPFEVWGDGKDYKDFIFIEDLVDGIVLALEKADGYHVYNLATGRNVTINDALKIILRCGNYEEAKIVYNTDKPMMIPYKVLCIDKARQELGFEAKTSLEEGIRKTMEWYRRHPSVD
ncbi:dTDP-4-oxo-6-deoxy-D-allose reductase [bioreactor metagenome]|uniref:dTDP-4-oxo-6-deoxy-D-allose reductase n=1 Tax=bioreactor metagenome TaxID=1076179 RepID=A0A644WXP3_9ZZZZ|nr:NAD-dependent epimerase/dehydratase family protein [Clostridiaceae bacterium]